MLTRRFVISALLASVTLPACAGAPETSLRPQARPLRGGAKVKASHTRVELEQIIAEAQLTGEVSVVVADAATGQILEAHAPNNALPPASVTKSVTALYAMQHLGADYRFATRVIATGPVQNGIVQGDLVLAGGGDPHLDTDGLAKLAAGLKARGITGVSGKFRVYSGALPYQKSIDVKQPDHVGYNPSLSGLNLNFNRVYFEWKRGQNGYRTTMDARTNKYRPQVYGINVGIVNRSGPLFTYKQGQKTEEWTVMRGALGKGGGRWLPVRNLDAYAGGVFRTLASQNGVKLPAPQPVNSLPAGTVVAQEISDPLREQIRAMLKYSTNLTAEITGLATSVNRGSSVRNLSGSAKEMTDWVKRAYSVQGVRFVDHSGLGDASRVSAAQMTRILTQAGWNGPLRPILKDIKLVNSNGKAAPIGTTKVVAKTGTLNFASALSGYIEGENGRKLAFSIFTADMSKRAKIKRSEREAPQGGRAWVRRSKRMQQRLLRRWALEYGVSA